MSDAGSTSPSRQVWLAARARAWISESREGVNIGGSHYGQFNRGDESLREIATFVDGKNTLEFGGEILRVTTPVVNQYEQDGIFSFSNSLSGDNTADFLLGAVSNLTQAGGLFLNLTASTGLRSYRMTFASVPANPERRSALGPMDSLHRQPGRLGCFEPGAQSTRFPNSPQGLIFGGDNHDVGCPKGAMFKSPWNLGPRVGLPGRPQRMERPACGAGPVIYYQTPEYAGVPTSGGHPSLRPDCFADRCQLHQSLSERRRSQSVSGGIWSFESGAQRRLSPGPALEPVFAQHFHLATTLTWNLTVERSLGQNMLLRLGYMGSVGTHLSGTGDQEAGEFQENPAIYIPGQSSEANTQQRRVYPNLGQINLYDSEINSNYSAAQITLEKRFSKGLSFWPTTPIQNAGRLWPLRCIGGNEYVHLWPLLRLWPDSGGPHQRVQNLRKLSLPRVPVNGVAGKLVNGWQLTGIGTWLSGFPLHGV